MNRLTRYISAGIFTGLIFLLLLAAYSSQAVKRGRMACTGVEVTVLDSMKNSFVDSRDILSYLRSEYGDFTGKNVDSISLIRIEKDVDARSAVRKSEAYITKDGILHVDITQREPAVRFQKGEAGFYADAEGFAVTNVSLKAVKDIRVTRSFSLPLFAAVSVNPSTEKAYFVFGLTLRP